MKQKDCFIIKAISQKEMNEKEAKDEKEAREAREAINN